MHKTALASEESSRGISTFDDLPYRRLLETANEGVWIIDRDDRTTFVNATMAAMLGYTVDEMLGALVYDFMSETSAGIARANIQREREERGQQREFEFLRKDGSTVWTFLTSNGIFGGDGEYLGVLAMVSDLTELRRTNAELHLQSAALNAAANSIVITDVKGVVVWVNAAFAELTGYDIDEALGRNLRDLVRSGVQDDRFYKNLWDTILAGRVWRGEITNRRKDGTLYREYMVITPVTNAGAANGITHFIAIKNDLTEQKQLEARFLQAQKMECVGRLAGGVAHDFNNLLTVINGMSDMVASQLKPLDPLYADVQEIRKAGERASLLTGQLLGFSRRQVVKRTALNLGTLVADLQKMLQRVIGEDIRLVIEGRAGNLLADRTQLEQVLMNLVVNARDAMPRGGVLTITTADIEFDDVQAAEAGCAHPGAYVALTVADTGIGMDQATRARLFEPFFTTKEQGKGTGLGLATVFTIVEQNDGVIAVETEPGLGTSFTMHFPRLDAPAEGIALSESHPEARATETVLIVEDDDAVRRLVRRMLEAEGYQVLTARGAGDALLLMERHDGPLHLIVTDVVMPGLSGPDLIARLTEIRPATKVLYMSGHVENPAVYAAIQGGDTQFISKPYKRADLARKVREILQKG